MAALTAVAAALGVPEASWASDIFMKLGEPRGVDVGSCEETAKLKSFLGDIAVTSAKVHLENPTTLGSASGGAGTGKVKLDPIT
jgi:hypothetical protein